MRKNNSYLIVGHGKFPEGIYSSLCFIMGEQKSFSYINYDSNITDKELKSNIESFIKKNVDNEVTILCDLKNGTPYNKALELKLDRYPDINIIFGINLPLLISISQSEMFDSGMINLDEILKSNSKQSGLLRLEPVEEDDDEL